MHIDHTVEGEGEPLVLIHGLFGTRENLGAIARRLKHSHKIYAIDLPNHGRSEFSDHISLAGLANAVLGWMDEQKLSEAHFFGHSLGGKVAMELALLAPDRVRSIIVADIAPVGYEQRHQDVFAGLLAVDLDAINSRRDAEAMLAAHVQEPAVRGFLLRSLKRDSEGRYAWQLNVRGLKDSYMELIKGNRLGQANIPVLFLKAQNSDYILERHREEILSRFPKATLKVVSNTAHWLHAEKPEVVAKLSENFLAKLSN